MFLGQKLEAKVIFHERIVDSNESCCKKERPLAGRMERWRDFRDHAEHEQGIATGSASRRHRG